MINRSFAVSETPVASIWALAAAEGSSLFPHARVK